MQCSTMEREAGSRSRRETKERSIFNSEKGSRRSWSSDEYPRPKSSSASEKPFSRRRVRMSSADTASRATEVSVISKCRRDAVRPLVARCAITRSGNVTSVSDTGGRLIEMEMSGSMDAAAPAFSITRHVSACARSAASAIWTNMSGGMSGPSACCHLTSASTPTTCPVRSDTCGWKCRTRRSSSNAACSAASVTSNARLAAAAAGASLAVSSCVSVARRTGFVRAPITFNPYDAASPRADASTRSSKPLTRMMRARLWRSARCRSSSMPSRRGIQRSSTITSRSS